MFYFVNVQTVEFDEGYTMTFRTEREAKAAYDHAISAGCYRVTIWK